ncbi:MAG TPA: hypothetical protein V6D09_12465 [Leptolyngbyaceae cyanobacterium]
MTDAISHLNRSGVPQKHCLIEPDTFAPLSLKEVGLEDFQEINIKKAIAMVKN